MLQVARLARRQLAEARETVSDWLLDELADNGGARDRSGAGDLYYSAFLLEDLVALQAPVPVERVRAYLAGFGDGAGLDFVHRACLVRCHASLGAGFPGEGFARATTTALETCRSADGGYAATPGQSDGTLYHAFLALGVYQDLGLALPEPAGVGASLARLRTPDGGYANALDLPVGTTPSTAAAAALLRHLDLPRPPGVGEWLLRQASPAGGFLAMPHAPLPDLLSTATALHALASLEVPVDGLRERTLDFLDSLWTGRAFVGTWEDDEPDCEYLFYALLALGHLSV